MTRGQPPAAPRPDAPERHVAALPSRRGRLLLSAGRSRHCRDEVRRLTPLRRRHRGGLRLGAAPRCRRGRRHCGLRRRCTCGGPGLQRLDALQLAGRPGQRIVWRVDWVFCCYDVQATAARKRRRRQRGGHGAALPAARQRPGAAAGAQQPAPALAHEGANVCRQQWWLRSALQATVAGGSWDGGCRLGPLSLGQRRGH